MTVTTMDQYDESLITWNKLADLYQEKFMDLDIYNESYDQFCGSIPKQQASILDIGCGPGNTTRYLLKKRPDFIVTAIDNAPNMIALAQMNNPSAFCKVLDTRNLHDLTDKFDGILAGFVLPYLSESDIRKFLFDSRNILCRQGMLYFSFVEGDPAQSEFKCRSNGDRIFFNYHSINFIKMCLAETKFQDPTVLRVCYQQSPTVSEYHTIILTSPREDA